MENSTHKVFKVKINTAALGNKTIEVSHAETTDGAPYYTFQLAGEEIQLRKDQRWEQIWGSLSKEDVEALGAEIDKHLL